MHSYVKESVGLLRKMVSQPSVSFEEDAVAGLVFDQLSEWNLSPLRYGNNILAVNTLYDKDKPTLVLDAHLDTVPAASGYTRNPFCSGEDPDIVYGLGSNDDGGSVAAMIAVFRHFREMQMPVNIVLDLNCQEERSGPEGDSFLFGPDGPEYTRDAKWVIIGEPTGMEVATSERGLLVLDGLAEGVSGHAARGEGVNALYVALDDIKALREHEFSKISSLMGEVRLNVTQINAGTAHNVIPDKCTFVVDVRPTELYDNQELTEELQALCQSRLTPRNLKNSSSATREGSAFLKTVKALNWKSFSSPTTSNWVRINKDAVKMGPGESCRSHKADEFVKVSEIEDAFEKYIAFIDKFYGYALE